MIIDIPFELNQEVYVYENQRYSTQVWMPPDYSLGGDADGAFDRGHYNTEWHDNYKIVKKDFVLAYLINIQLMKFLQVNQNAKDI